MDVKISMLLYRGVHKKGVSSTSFVRPELQVFTLPCHTGGNNRWVAYACCSMLMRDYCLKKRRPRYAATYALRRRSVVLCRLWLERMCEVRSYNDRRRETSFLCIMSLVIPPKGKCCATMQRYKHFVPRPNFFTIFFVLF